MKRLLCLLLCAMLLMTQSGCGGTKKYTADTFAFDTVFIVRKLREDVNLEPYRKYLNSIGDSLVIGEDDEAFKVHVHTDIPGNALNEGQKYGILELAKIENMRTQADDMAAGRKTQSVDDLDMEDAAAEAPAEEAHVVAEPEKKYGFVSVCLGDGIANAFRDIGADRIIHGGQTMNPSTDDILKEINKTPAEIVYVLPNNKNIIMAAQQAVPMSEKEVIVIESKTIPQGVSAMLAFDPDASGEDNKANMSDAMSMVTSGQVTFAARDSDFDGKEIKDSKEEKERIFYVPDDIYFVANSTISPSQGSETI